MASNIYCIVLAAGISRRYGRTKLLEELNGKPLLCHALEAAQTACPGRVCLVTGNDQAAVQDAGQEQADLVVHNPDFRSGIGSSIRCGVRACSGQTDALLIVLADQPLVPAGHLTTMIDTWDGKTTGIVASAYSGTRGAPVLFGRSYFAALADLSSDSGAKTILRDNPAVVRSVNCARAAIDIDTPADLEALLNPR